MKNIKISKEICFQLFGKPKIYQEWTNRFNVVGDVQTIHLTGKITNKKELN